MKKALENVKKPNFVSDFRLFTPNLKPPKFFLEFHFHELSNITPSYYRMQFKVKLMNELEKMEKKKKSTFGPILACFAKICPLKLFSINLALLVVKCCPKLLCYAI